MKIESKWAVVVLAVMGLGVVGSSTRGEDVRGEEPTTKPSELQAASGTISGRVMKASEPLANARVGLIDVSELPQKHAKGEKKSGDAKEKRQRPAIALQTTTDSEGKFTLNDVKAGQYMVVAMMRGEGRGRARARVYAGETASVEIQVIQGVGKGANGDGAGAKAGKVKKNKGAAA